MANNDFSKLSSRNQSSLVSQLYKLVSYYSSIFCTRERTYIKNLTKTAGNVYWLEDEAKRLMAVALMDPNYVFKVEEIEFNTLGHTISNKSGQMDRLLTHVFGVNEGRNILLLCKPFVADSLNHSDYKLVKFSPLELKDLFPALATLKTDYFNVKNEPLAEGMDRKDHNGYFRLSEEAMEKLSKDFPDFIKTYKKKLSELS